MGSGTSGSWRTAPATRTIAAIVMSGPADPYKVLQVDPDAEPEVIRAAYRALALKCHPDVATGSQERMATLNQAWGILKDPFARAAHDRARRESQPGPSSPSPDPVTLTATKPHAANFLRKGTTPSVVMLNAGSQSAIARTGSVSRGSTTTMGIPSTMAVETSLDEVSLISISLGHGEVYVVGNALIKCATVPG